MCLSEISRLLLKDFIFHVIHVQPRKLGTMSLFEEEIVTYCNFYLYTCNLQIVNDQGGVVIFRVLPWGAGCGQFTLYQGLSRV